MCESHLSTIIITII